MKIYSAKKISLVISVIITVLISFALLLDYFFTKYDTLLLFTIPVFFGLTFFLVLYILSLNNYDKIKPLYQFIRGITIQKERKTGSKHFDKKAVDNNNLSDSMSWTEEQLREIERLKDLEKYRKEFVGNVSHELKTPIFNIQGYILTLLEGGINDPKINKLYLQRTEKSIDRMISIVEDLESITRLESGELKLKYENFDIVKLVEEVYELEHMIAHELNISLELPKKPESPLLVRADKKKIFEALSNLVSNAIKYGKKKGFVSVSFYDFENRVIVEVKDNGIGIDRKVQPRIFERFFRVDKSRSRRQAGTGLGLSIVKHIIEAHDQTISVQSVPDIGTTFTFTLNKAVL